MIKKVADIYNHVADSRDHLDLAIKILKSFSKQELNRLAPYITIFELEELIDKLTAILEDMV